MQQGLGVRADGHRARRLTDDVAACIGGGQRVGCLALGAIDRRKDIEPPHLVGQANLACDVHGLVECARTGCSEGGRVDALVVVAELDAQVRGSGRYLVLDGDDHLTREAVHRDVLVAAAGDVEVVVLAEGRTEGCAVEDAFVVT